VTAREADSAWCDEHAVPTSTCGCADGTLVTHVTPRQGGPELGGNSLTSADTPDGTLVTHVTPLQGPGLLGALRTGDWLDAQTFPPLSFVVPGIIPEGGSLLVAPPKAGKSWFVVNVGLAVASGGVALSALPVGKPRPVLLLALEDGDRRLQSRTRALLAGAPIPPLFTYLTTVRPGRVVDTIAEWCDVYGSQALVIVDTLGKVMPPALPGESAYARDYRIAGGIKRLADDRPGLSVVVVHHDRKAGSDDFVDAVSGTHGIAGAMDTILVLGRPRTTGEGVLKVTGRDVVEAEYAVRLVDGRDWHLAGESLTAAQAAARVQQVTAGTGAAMTQVIAAVASFGGDGASIADVARVTGLDSELVRAYLARAGKAGRIDRIDRGRYAPLPVSQVSQVSLSESDSENGWTW
jgi:hypothetical protein